MANTLYTVPICATAFNLFTYTGNQSGAMSTYVNNVSAIIGGAVGVNPTDIFNFYSPQGGDLVNFQPGRSYIVVGKGSTFNLGISGTREQAMPDKRYINSKTVGGTSTFVNIVGFDSNTLKTALSTAFSVGLNQQTGGIAVQTNDNSANRTQFKVWTTALQELYNVSSPEAKAELINNPNNIFFLEPLSSYYIRSSLTTGPLTVSAVRINDYLLSDSKDFQNDNIFIVTDDGKYIKLN